MASDSSLQLVAEKNWFVIYLSSLSIILTDIFGKIYDSGQRILVKWFVCVVFVGSVLFVT